MENENANKYTLNSMKLNIKEGILEMKCCMIHNDWQPVPRITNFLLKLSTLILKNFNHLKLSKWYKPYLVKIIKQATRSNDKNKIK